MKRRSNLQTIIAVAVMSLLWASELHASELTSASQTAEPRDTVLSEVTKDLIKSFGELSKTATKLSETTLKLLEAQQALEEKEENGGRSERAVQEENPVRNQTVTRTRKSSPKKTATPPKRVSENPEQSEISADNATDEIYEIPTYSEFTEVPETPQYTNPVYIEEGEETYEEPDSSQTLRSIWDLEPEEGQGGHYVWVPDGVSLQPSNTSSLEPNLNEMVYWRGDSIPMAIPTKRLGRYDRKLYNWLIYPKGQWHISLSANYGELTTEDSEILSLMDDINVHGIIYSIKPSVSYFFKSNLCAGIRLAFTKGELGIDSFKVDIDEDINFDLHDIKYSSESYTAAIFLQQHFGLSRRGRFSVYNEVEIAAGTGNKHFIRPFDGELKDTRTKTQSFNINYSPGVSIMMMKNAAFNLSFGIFGFHLQNEKQWENGEESGNRLTSGINFRFNIFNINFGVSVII